MGACASSGEHAARVRGGCVAPRARDRRDEPTRQAAVVTIGPLALLLEGGGSRVSVAPTVDNQCPCTGRRVARQEEV
jgi:hypothetical protein